MAKELEHLEKEMKAHGWTSRIGTNEKGKKEWVLIDPQGKPLASAWPPFVKGFAYGFLRGREER